MQGKLRIFLNKFVHARISSQFCNGISSICLARILQLQSLRAYMHIFHLAEISFFNLPIFERLIIEYGGICVIVAQVNKLGKFN